MAKIKYERHRARWILDRRFDFYWPTPTLREDATLRNWKNIVGIRVRAFGYHHFIGFREDR